MNRDDEEYETQLDAYSRSQHYDHDLVADEQMRLSGTNPSSR
jgi:hypothetical protein